MLALVKDGVVHFIPLQAVHLNRCKHFVGFVRLRSLRVSILEFWMIRPILVTEKATKYSLADFSFVYYECNYLSEKATLVIRNAVTAESL